jgi:GNAT superfamily N-acetyltransferase
MPAALSVWPAVETDLPALLGLLALLHDPPPLRAVAPSAEPWEAFFRIAADRSRTLLVAEREGRPVGTLDLLVVPNLAHGARPWAMIENVLVDPSQRRSGIATSLTGNALERAGKAGCYKVQLLSDRRRREAHALYRGLGLEPSSEGFRLYLK